jgi:hypothetical protein
MAITQNTFTGNGSNLGPFSFTFKWLEPTDIKVTVGGVLKTAGTHYNLQSLNYTTKDGGQVLFTAGNAPADNATIRIYRDTDDSALSATFFSGSAIRAQDLNDDFTQNLYTTQEVKARYLDRQSGEMDSGYIPSTSTSVVTKEYMETNYGIIDEVGFTRWRKTATAGQTTFSGTGNYGGVLTYVPTREQVYINGALQQRSADYTADNGTSVVFAVGLTVGDVVDIVCINNVVAGTANNAANITYSGQFSGQTARTVAAKLADVVSVTDYGADPTGVTDSLAAIQAAAATHSGLYFPRGTYRLSGTLNLRSELIMAEEASFSCDHSGIGIILGGDQASSDNPIQKVRTVTRVSGDYSTTPAVQIIGAKNQQIWVKRCPYIQLYADTDSATATSCAYSSFWFNYVDKLELETNPTPSGSTIQWINENVFYLNRITNLRVAGTYAHNNNKFLYGSFENGTIDFQVGRDNRVEGIRGEGDCSVTFAGGTANNVVLATWQSSGMDFIYPGTVTDNGIGNHVGHQRWVDNKLTTLTAFTYNNLRQHPDGTYNVSGVSNLTIGASSLTASSFAYIYDSGIIPCNGAGVGFISQLIGRISGGYRIIVDGYNSSKVAITGTVGDVNIRGVGGVAFGSEAPATTDGSTGGLYGWVQNSSTRFIRIRVRASTNALNAEGLVLSLRYNNNDQLAERALAESGAMTTPIPNSLSLTKSVTLSDNVQATVFTFAIPAVSTLNHNVSFGFEVSYTIRCSRETSTRSWRTTYGKVYGAISRGWENDTNAAPVFTITTTDQALVTTNTAPTITWAASLDAGTDNAAKNGYLAITVDNPLVATNRTSIVATINWIVGGGPSALTNVVVS